MKSSLSIRQFHLFTGMVLMAYVSMHFLNHALGLRSLEAMEAGQRLFIALWRHPAATLLLYLALAAHLLLAFYAIYRRDRFSSLKRWEATQLIVGLVLPLILIQHVIGTRGMHELFELNDRYSYTVLVMWKYLPYLAWLQPLTMILVWLHGCIGLYFWMRLKPWYGHWKQGLFAVAVLVPTLGVLGFLDAGLTALALALAQDSQWENMLRQSANAPSDEAVEQAESLIAQGRGAYIVLLVLVLALRHMRLFYRDRSSKVSIRYEDGETVRIQKGISVLEASRMAGLPHASVCGGRGRCSTCRVRVAAGVGDLPPPDSNERKVLKRVGAPPNVRLACQLRPAHSIEVMRLLSPEGAGPGHTWARQEYTYGAEKEIAVLFADIRGFTGLSERRLPYDTVFLLNRYFKEMGQAVETAGGRLDKFIGDGVMALFGIERGPGPGTRSALQAAAGMLNKLNTLNESLQGDLEEPLRIGIGIHFGTAIVGEMGYGKATTLTAIGDVVNVASRLEAMTKELGVTLVFSDDVARGAGILSNDIPSKSVHVRGRGQPLVVRLIQQPEQIERALAQSL